MSCRVSVASFCCLVFSSAALWAGPATPEGVARLTAALETYLGKTPGVVSVRPDGDSYAVTLDPAPLLARIPANEAKATVSPLEMTLTDLGDGTWEVAQEQPFAVAVDAPGAVQFRLDLGAMTLNGVYDERLKSFVTATGKVADVTMTQVTTLPDEPAQTVTYAIDTIDYASSAVAGATGGVDAEQRYTATGMTQIMAMPPLAPGGAPFDVTIRMDRYEDVTTGTGLRADAILDLVAWFVAHPSEFEIKANQAEMRALLGDAIPIFNSVRNHGAATGITVTTPLGPVAIASVELEIEVNGVVADGLLREAVSVSGLSLAEGMVPDWAAHLVPDTLSFDFAASQFDLVAPARIFLDVLDLDRPDVVSPEAGNAMLAAFLPKGAAELRLAPGQVTAPLYGITYEGAMSIGPEAQPTGAARITARGYDAVIAALNAAPEDVRMSLGPALAMVQGMARAAPEGGLLWEIDATRPGTLLVNGVDVLAFGREE